MINTGKYLSRRTVLRGLGATIALPLLDGMVPAFAAMRKTAANPVRRLGAVYLPNGMSMMHWTPATEGTGFELSPILQPLASVRDRMLVLTGMANREANSRPGEGDGDHSRAQAAFLTGAHAKKTGGADLYAGVSMDQIAARILGQQTQLASLELSLESNDLIGQCEDGYGCAYSATIAWRNATTPVPMESDPRAAFERLFGASDSTESQARRRHLERDRSILDSVAQELAHLQHDLGAGDRTKLTSYLEAVRDVERRIQIAEQQSDRELPAIDQPAGIPTSFEDYGNIMFDLMWLAYQCDLTRVVTFLYGREKSVRTYPEIGVPEPHHPTSHHRGLPEEIEKLRKINVFHTRVFARFIEKMRDTPDGDGSLLDHSMIVYGAGISNSNAHTHVDLPILLLGAGGGQVQTGRHLRLAMDTPLANLHMTLLDKMGVEVEERLGDATGTVELLSGV